MASQTTFNRNMIIATVLLAVALLLGVGVFGLKPPKIKAGYYEAPKVVVENTDRVVLSEARRQELEALLSPPPILAWNNEASTQDVPENLTNDDVILSFSTTIDKDEAEKESDLKAETKSEPDKVPEPEASETQQQAALSTDQSLPKLERSTKDRFEIEPVYLAHLPDLAPLSVDQRKKRFVAFMLPLILRANVELENRRALIMRDIENQNVERLRQWAELYRVKTNSSDVGELEQALLKRVDTVPVSLALAQAAIESGWGTSRFAVQGNALFGQWAWSQSEGLKPNESRYENAVVRSFVTLFDSVRAYMHNLNTHHSYEDFRQARAMPDAMTADMVKTLINYSEEREAYISKLFSVISKNNFQDYDDAVLLEK